MKKTLLTVLCLALGVSFANAQTNSEMRSVNRSQDVQMAASVDRNDVQRSYKASIFQTKDSIWGTTFSQADSVAGKFTTGTIGTATTYGTVEVPAHTTTNLGSTWMRIPDTSHATVSSQFFTSNFPYTYSWFSRSLNLINTPTHDDGFMLMSMVESSQTQDMGAYDAYIAFQSFSTVGFDVVDMMLYQYFRKFNNDKSYIDYSTDGSTWNTMEVLVNGIDCRSNESVNGQQTFTLPLAVANQSNVYIRLRWTSNSRSGGAFGYYWAVDDVKFVGGGADRMRLSQHKYVSGLYQMMPAGLSSTIESFYRVRNVGPNTRTNIKANVYTMNDGGVEDQYGAPTSLATSQVVNNLPFTPAQDTLLLIDPRGELMGNGQTYGTTGALPTDLANGVHGFYYTAIETDGPTLHTDTLSYTVNSNSVSGMDGASVWGADNGVLRKYSRYTYGLTTDGYITSTATESGWSRPEYELLVNYVTGSTIPANWVIRGMQLVASTPYIAPTVTDQNGARGVNSTISPMLRYDTSYDGGNYISSVDHGGNAYEITAVDLPNMDGLTYATYGNYSVINIPFLNQPTLLPNKSYYVGYKQETGGNFACATSSYYYFDENHYTGSVHDTVSVMFSDVDGMHAFANPQKAPGILIHDPNYTSQYYYTSFGTSSGVSIPMIRMIVGPKVHMTKYALAATCGSDKVQIQAPDGSNICGEVDSLVQGSTRTYYVVPEHNYSIEQILIDGQPLANGAVVGNVSRTDNVDEATGTTYASISIVNVQEAHTISATVSGEGIEDPAAKGVSMKLQPNPATSNVNLTISGVTGMVDYSLIDMSGRTISSSRINAENVNTINVSNLAKGAYFVRITGNKFSKVEKLIVR